MTVFLDTVGLLAIWDESDQWHPAAQAAFTKLSAARAELVTTTSVLLECGNAAARRPYRGAVARLRVELEAAGRLLTPTTEDWTTAWRHYLAGAVGSAGIVDQLSFAVMRRLRLTHVFTNDQHFQQAGFQTLF